MFVIQTQVYRIFRSVSNTSFVLLSIVGGLLFTLLTSPLAAQGTANSSGQPNTYGAAMQGSMNAEALILFLGRHPSILREAKQRMAQSTGDDAGTISDQALFDRLRQDPLLAGKVTDRLRQMGYDTNSISDNGPASGVQAPPQAQTLQPPLQTVQTPVLSQNGTCPPGYAAQVTSTIQQPTIGVPTQAAAQSSAPLILQPQTPAPVVCQPASAPQIPIPNVAPAAPPTMHQRIVPYPSIPSLSDLYSQMTVPDNSTLKRFGSDVFVLGSGNTDTLPMDLPAGPDYVLGPGDVLNVNIWGSQSQTLSVTIDRQGNITLPESGSATISGLTIAAAEAAIKKSLHTQFKDMHVEISLGRVRTVRIYVVGDVQRPGAYDISSLSTPLNALYASGGPTATGSLRVLRHYRGKELISEVDLYDFLLHGIRSSVERLLPGDTILVPPVGPQVTVNGMVRRPAIYELKGPENLKEVLNIAGGLLVDATLREIKIERVDGHERRTTLSVRIPENAQTDLSGEVENLNPFPSETDPAVVAKLASFRMQDGDAVLVRPILPYNEAVVYLDGHVFRPGKYPYREGMTIGDLLHSYQDVMPEPADTAELTRLSAPDYRPSTTIINLPDVLSGNSSILLKPFDALHVFSRYEVDSPTVTIVGEIIRPGDYPMGKGMTVSGLIKMAGGFRRSAYRIQGDLASYTVHEGQRVLLQSTVISLGPALGGDSSADVPLKPGDVLGIRQLSGWQDIGSAISLDGEVMFPGSYPISLGEHLSSVIKRAGGFLESANPNGAVLERNVIRAMSEAARTQLIQKIESLNLSSDVMSGAQDNAQSTAETFQLLRSQQQEALAALKAAPPNGRLVIKIGRDVSKWENTPADVEVRAGDTFSVPKLNGFVIVAGQVYNQTAISFSPRKTAGWYLRQAGGATRNANKRDVYILRSDGSVLSRAGFMQGTVLSDRLRPGDAIIVPEKLVGTPIWKTLFSAAQAMIAPAMLGILATR